MHKDVRVIKHLCDSNTIQVLEGLLEQAKHGDLVGMAYVTIHVRQRWGKGVCGAARDDCVLTIGGLSALQSDLANALRSRIMEVQCPPLSGVFPISNNDKQE